MIENTGNLFARASAALLEQFKRRPKVNALLGNYVAELQALEGAFYDIYASRNVNAAEGDQLDILGTIVGLARNGRTDVEYRVAIKSQVAINISSGTPDEIMDIMRAVLGYDGVFTEDVAYILYRVPSETHPIPTGAADYAAVLHALTPAGVGSQFQYGMTTTPFCFDGPAGSGFDEGDFEDVL